MTGGSARWMILGMRKPKMVKRYALARPGATKPRLEEGIRRLRLVRMEAIAEMDRARAAVAPQGRPV